MAQASAGGGTFAFYWKVTLAARAAARTTHALRYLELNLMWFLLELHRVFYQYWFFPVRGL